ncbi:DUF2271 domain-containing protein [Algiphilus sp. W345]|uniref:DUF2271 domain-containing protein n=1 Tax=Banduia mediterranea TaxID=3075609 RepID=A0ABU2WIG0_9GAMM|nr:DUF2271 domain-containing protein [Algiphilus sp. W345]MDT0497647.1 DUF2271 domain-containing protein [Algiphilus sp. W345]
MKRLSLIIGALLSGAAHTASGAKMDLSVEVPRLSVAEYHKPYVAAWIEREDRSVAATLFVWYELDKRGRESGDKWLKDLRQWWRRGGRGLDMPVDGISSATRAPGVHALSFGADSAALKALTPGHYRLQVEAAREVGGRELLSLEFDWPVDGTFTDKTQGDSELGRIELKIAP